MVKEEDLLNLNLKNQKVLMKVLNANLVIILNNHILFRNLNLNEKCKMMKSKGIIYDCWNLFNKSNLKLKKNNLFCIWKYMKKKILITGGTGFIGSAIADKLAKDNDVIVVDNNQRGLNKRLDAIRNKIKIVNFDIRNEKQLINASKGVDTIIHAAYVNGTETFYKKPKEILDIAIKGMLNVLNACEMNNIRELALLSSSKYITMPNYSYSRRYSINNP